MESILTSIKKLLGITEDDESFDSDITTDINSVFLNLKQYYKKEEKFLSPHFTIKTFLLGMFSGIYHNLLKRRGL